MRSLTIAVIAALTATGCNERVTAPREGTSLQRAAPTGEAVILGQVIGRTFSHSPGDSGFTFTDEPVAKAQVDAFLFQVDSAPPDSGGHADSLPFIFVASTTTNAQGLFQFTALQAGTYLLTAAPPADSPFDRGSVTLSVDEHGTTNAVILVFEFPDSVPPDTTPPPPPPDSLPDDSLPPSPPPPPPPDSTLASGGGVLPRLFRR
jgi:hypothetical protein